MSDTNVRLQNLRDFTVQIRDADDQVVGTGIAVSTDGKIVTCAHVVEAAIGTHPRNANDAEITVYFPQVRGGEEKKRSAMIAKYFNDYDDDVVLLQLKGPFPLAPEQIPVLGTANSSEENPFRSYGYRRLDQYIAGWAHGKIQGCVEAPEGFNFQCEPVQLESSQINSGMSGSAVLDMTRNLVVGIVSETWFPDLSTKDRDTAWAVDGRVLSLEPLGLPLQDISLPLTPAPEPKTDEQTKQQAVQVAQVTVAERRISEKFSWNNAPSVLSEWTGRSHLLMHITEDWNNPQKRVTGLIGFGGEGKSSLARKWVDDLLNDPSQRQPDGVFWWGFYENRSVDEFLEAALNYMSGGRIDPRAVPSSNLRAQIIAAMLGSGQYLFVLDGLEVIQHQDGDQYGLLQSNDLRDLLTFFARPDHQSFCLITSRAPVLDLMNYITYTHRDVERLSEDDGRTLLGVLGVKGSDADLNRAVTDWGGHALTLSILAAYLVARYDGDIKHLADLPVPTASEPRYERVHRLLRRYDECLTEDERKFLKIFSVFRLPVHEYAFDKVFLPLLNMGNKEALLKLISRLSNYRLIRRDEYEKSYIIHPLIRNHFFILFTSSNALQTKVAHEKIKEYYLSIIGTIPQHPTLDDVKPLIEAIHHSCCSGTFDDAYELYTRIEAPPDIYPPDGRSILMFELGAHGTGVELLSDFFENSDFSNEPQVISLSTKSIILTDLGIAMVSLGKLNKAELYYQRALEIDLQTQNWGYVSVSYQDLAEVNLFLGKIDIAGLNAQLAIDFARRAGNTGEEWSSLSYQARAAFLVANLELAEQSFRQSIYVHNRVYPEMKFLHDLWGIWYTEYLIKLGHIEDAYQVILNNLRYSETEHQPEIISQCHCILGGLFSDIGDYGSALKHYSSALKIARSISGRDILIEILLARGRWQAKHMKNADAAFSDLNEALSYCVESGYRIYETDVRIALGWAYLADNEKQKAKQSAEHALQMSKEMGYYWGRVDAEEVLSVIASPSH
jgi:tetratricopeptide (TPR) repeat protein